MTGRSYGLLRAIAILLKVLAWIALVAGIVGLVAVLMGASQLSNSVIGGLPGTQVIPRMLTTVGAVAAPLLGVVWFIQLYAFGSIISLLINIEENTRATALPTS